MSTNRKVVFALVFAVVIGGLIVGLGAGYGNRGNTPEGIDKSPPRVAAQENLLKGVVDKETPAKEPDAKAPPVAAEPAPRKFKVITMAEAVTIAEKVGKGYTLKAERKEKPDIIFKFDIMGIDGAKSKIELAADGTVMPASANATMTKGGMTKKGESLKKFRPK